MSRLPTFAFGYEFTHIPEHARRDVSSLEREQALYTDHWIKELDDFRHVRIDFTAEEAQDYARRTWAFELFLRAERPRWARDVEGIDPDVAHDADTYQMCLEDGTEYPPPYHCFAAFLGPHLEAISCGAMLDRRTTLELKGKESALFTVARAVETLTPTIRSFDNREKGLEPWTVTREDDVRDLLYVMLRPGLFDLVKEVPTPSRARTQKFVDLCSKSARSVLAVKGIGQKNHWKKTLEQIHVDVQCYPTHPACETLIFVIVDAVRDLPDPRLTERELSGQQVIKGRTIDIRAYVVNP